MEQKWNERAAPTSPLTAVWKCDICSTLNRRLLRFYLFRDREARPKRSQILVTQLVGDFSELEWSDIYAAIATQP